MTARIYVEPNKQVGDVDHLKVANRMPRTSGSRHRTPKA
jgi:hypothetical protein